jgi:hypothetical protein
MTETTHNRLGPGIVIVLAGLVASVAIAATAFGSKSSETPAWEKALMARSDALNRHYRLGKYTGTRTRSARHAEMPPWEKAIMARSDALNRRYKLGKYAGTRTKTARTAVMPAWKKALIARSDAINRRYKLGKYAAR